MIDKRKQLEKFLKEETKKILKETPSGSSAQFKALKLSLDKIKDPDVAMLLDQLLSVLAGEYKFR